MPNLLILFAHPLLEKSRVQKELVKQAQLIPQITINDLYEAYPDFDIDVEREKRLLLSHDIIIWQHPFYWYSAPALLKQWQDLVLEHGWAYGKKGHALTGKKIFNVITSGGSMEAYQEGGYNKYSIHDYLKPFERTAGLCRMTYWPPYWIHGVHRMETEQIQIQGEAFKTLLSALATNAFSEQEIETRTLMNDLVSLTSTPT